MFESRYPDKMDKQLKILPLNEWGIFGTSRPAVIAGPCSAESEEQLLSTAKGVRDAGVNVLRAGIWKPRTRPGSFEGVGSEGLQWLSRAQKELGMKVCTEVANSRHIEEALAAGVDMLWIGARTTTNPFLMQEIADALKGHDVPVLVKNPVSPDLGLWIGAVERLYRSGLNRIGVIHRGFSLVEERKFRNSPQWQIAIELRSRLPQVPFFCDPSHMAGSSEFIGEISQRAMNLGLDGLMIETHDSPADALSDAAQQITPRQLSELLKGLSIRLTDSPDDCFKAQMDALRSQIDEFDDAILRALSGRMDVSRQMGEFKQKSNIAILQTARWEDVITRIHAKAEAYGLDEEFISRVYNAIHEASVQEQNRVLNGD